MIFVLVYHDIDTHLTHEDIEYIEKIIQKCNECREHRLL